LVNWQFTIGYWLLIRFDPYKEKLKSKRGVRPEILGLVKHIKTY